MRIGFDLDGVILKTNLAILRLMDLEKSKKKREEVYMYYYNNPEILLNPFDYASEEDIVFIITARSIKYKVPTLKFVDKYFPRANLVLLDHKEPKANEDMDKWYDKQAELKANAINQLKIDVYFEDSWKVVKRLRELCPNCKVIHFSKNRIE